MYTAYAHTHVIVVKRKIINIKPRFHCPTHDTNDSKAVNHLHCCGQRGLFWIWGTSDRLFSPRIPPQRVLVVQRTKTLVL